MIFIYIWPMSIWNGWNISLFMSSLTHDCACIIHQQISHGRFEHHLLESSETGNLFRSVNIRLGVKARRRVFLIYSPSSVDSPLMGAQCLQHESHFPLCEHVNQPLWVRHVSLALATLPLCISSANPVVWGHWSPAA